MNPRIYLLVDLAPLQYSLTPTINTKVESVIGERQSFSGYVRQRGAALLLLLMTLSIAGASVLMFIFSAPSRRDNDSQQTRVRLEEAREALLGYAIQHGRLPRPATSALDGRESSTPCVSDSECNGYLPWVTLGVSANDKWGKLLRYSVTAEFTRRPLSTASAIANKVILGRDSKGSLYFIAGQSNCDALTRCLPAVIFSNGKNNLGTNVQGIRQVNAISGNVDELLNDKSQMQFINRPLQAEENIPGGAFDDMLTWIALQSLYQRMTVAGSL